jgi:WD40 repeat protein
MASNKKQAGTKCESLAVLSVRLFSGIRSLLVPISGAYLVHICDRRGRKICLSGHTSRIILLSFSNDGNYLASIRIWPTNSTKRLPQQSDKKLFEGTNTLSLAWIFHPRTQISGHLGTMVLLSIFGMLNRKYAYIISITSGQIVQET